MTVFLYGGLPSSIQIGGRLNLNETVTDCWH